MKARGGRFLLILGAGLAALAFVVTYILMSRGTGGAASGNVPPVAVPQVRMRTVAVVNKVVPAFTVLDNTNVALLDLDETTVPEGAVSSPSAVYGMMSLIDLTAGQPIVANQLTKAGLSSALVRGEKAFSFPVREKDTFNNGLTENDHIDVLWTVRLKVNVPLRGDDNKIVYKEEVYTTTKTILQDVKVLRVVDLRAPIPTGDGEGNAEQTAATAAIGQSAMYLADAPLVAVIMLAVNDQQAEVLKYARENGDIDFTLRSSASVKEAQETGNVVNEETTGITINELIEEYGVLPPPLEWLPVQNGAPAPAPAP